MFNLPDTEKKLKSRISSYKSALNKEKRIYGHINDGGGKRYSLFILYFLLNDLKKAYAYFEWYKEEFPDDVGEPIQKLCWAISLHRMENDDEAEYMLAELMLSNLYIIPLIIGRDVKEYNMWHSSTDAFADYFEYIPAEVLKSIKETEVMWMIGLYDSLKFNRIRKRYIEIFRDLKDTKDMESRKKLLNESYSLLKHFEHSS